MSNSGQYRWWALGRSTVVTSRIVASWNQGNVLNGRKSSRSSSRSQNPPGATLATSTLKVGFPRSADFIFVFPDKAQGLRDVTRGQPRDSALDRSRVPAGTSPHLPRAGHAHGPAVLRERRSRSGTRWRAERWDSPCHNTRPERGRHLAAHRRRLGVTCRAAERPLQTDRVAEAPCWPNDMTVQRRTREGAKRLSRSTGCNGRLAMS